MQVDALLAFDDEVEQPGEDEAGDDTKVLAVPVDKLSNLYRNVESSRDLPEANDAAFTARAADRIAELVTITGGGAFVLCTSVRSMRALCAALRGRTPLPPQPRSLWAPTSPSPSCTACSSPFR